jgi:RNA polymerase sigma factor (TIGR02999 family)
LTGELSGLLQAIDAGDRGALDRAFALVYAELKQLARGQRHRAGAPTLSTTALVHEVYVKFAEGGTVAAESREHFYNLAARAMRQVLLDRARRAHARKRPGPEARLSLDGATALLDPVDAASTDLLDLDRALNALAALDARLAEVATLHLFAGLEFGEIAALRGVSDRTVLRDWRKTRAILIDALDPEPAP